VIGTDPGSGARLNEGPLVRNADWLNRELQQGGAATDAVITSVRSLGEVGGGQVGRLERLQVEWDRPAAGPASFIVKLPSDNRKVRAAAFATGTYANEWHFFARLAPTLRVRVPRCWAARYDESASEFLLVLEDLAGSAPGDQFSGLAVGQVHLAARAAAALHAGRWADPDLEGLSPQRLSAGERADHLATIYRTSVRRFVHRVGPLVAPEIVALVCALTGDVRQWALGTGTPHTLVHHDFRSENLLFGCSPGAPDLAVVDWQTVRGGLGMCDLAYLVGGSVAPEVRAGSEREFVEAYLAALRGYGVTYSAATAWRDYRFCSLWGVIMTVMAATLSEPSARADRLLALMAERHGWHAIELDAVSVLRDISPG
jgi:aminoglycoside phosphotransferase (APT) family kinase protein